MCDLVIWFFNARTQEIRYARCKRCGEEMDGTPKPCVPNRAHFVDADWPGTYDSLVRPTDT